MKYFDLIAAPVFSANGECCGHVLGVSVFCGKPVYLLCTDEDEAEFAVSVRSVASLGKTVVLKQGANLIALDAEFEKTLGATLRLGKPCYSEAGSFLGHLTDVELSASKIKYALIGKRKIDFANVVYGDAVIIKTDSVLKSEVAERPASGKTETKRGKGELGPRAGAKKPVAKCSSGEVVERGEKFSENGKIVESGGVAAKVNSEPPAARVLQNGEQSTARVLHGDVIKNGQVLFECGTELCEEVLSSAKINGEYIQTNLKSL